jgi:hypothetical protein
MKKTFLKKCSGFALAAIGAVSLTACGGGGSSTAGSYEMTSVEMSGVEMSMEELASLMGMDAGELAVTLELGSDGSFTLDSYSMTGTDPVEGTWKEDSGSLSLTAEGETIDAEIEDGAIVLDEPTSSVTMVFEK